jgi:CRP/FNR family cyclic AMP-dependent transcriptional regulator
MSIQFETRFQHEYIEDFDDGECIFEEGDTGRDLYIIQSGSVQIRKKTGSHEFDLTVFNKGDFFGDMALLQSLPRYASAYAKGKTRLLILKPAGFLLKIRRDPTFAFEMIQQLSYRVKMTNDRLLELIKRHEIPKDDVQKILNTLGGASGSGDKGPHNP